LGELKSNFVSSVSHEMRAPIASVRLMAEELVDRGPADPAKAGEYHGYILQECRRLSALIENVLDFSRHEQGRKQYRFEPADLVPLVDETIHVMASYAADRRVTLERRIEGAPFEVDVDAAAMRQVLVNLVDNAIKHSPPAAVVEIELCYPAVGQHSGGESGGNGAVPSIRLEVRDDGPGIPEDEQRLIFQRFYRRGSELRRETQGIGLGLAIVQYIVEAHGGSVGVERPTSPRAKSRTNTRRRVLDKRLRVGGTNPLGESLIDPVRGRIEGRVGTVDGHCCPNQVPKESSDN
jgi:signal transduction histidine kinase